MPRRALRCVVDLNIHAVSAPGVWLPSREDVYLSVSMFGQYRNTRLLTSVFPLLLHEHFRFEKERTLSFRKTRRSPTRRARSPSLSRKLADADLSDDTKPPFVVRKTDKDLIARSPGGGSDTHAKSKGTKTKKGLSRDDLDLGRSRKHQYHLEKVIREPLEDPLPVFRSKYGGSDAEDAEVADLTSRNTSTYVPPRPRSASPVQYRPSFSARYGTRPYSPTYYSLLADRVRRRLEESRLARLADVTYPYWPYYYSTLDRYRYLYPYYDTLRDLELSTELARSRSPKSLVHVDNGHYWTERAAQLGGKAHRELFNSNLSKSYNRLTRSARSLGSSKT